MDELGGSGGVAEAAGAAGCLLGGATAVAILLVLAACAVVELWLRG